MLMIPQVQVMNEMNKCDILNKPNYEHHQINVYGIWYNLTSNTTYITIWYQWSNFSQECQS